jgi:survival-of-motor-neuron-related-splicing factor 30
LVKFTQYNVTEQLGPRDLKVQGRKRRGGSPAPQAGFTATGAAGAVGPTLQAPVVISKPAAVDEAAMRERKEGAEGVKKKKKIDKGKGALEAEKKKWQTFAAKGVKGARVGKTKKIGEGSMFRTPESVNGRGMFAEVKGNPMGWTTGGLWG